MFILYFILGVFISAFVCGVAYTSIQRDQWVDLIFKWQDKLEKFGQSPGVLNAILYKALGGCTYCFCHFVSVLCFAFFALFLVIMGAWFSLPSIWLQIIVNVIIYLAFVCSATSLGFIHVTKWMVRKND